MFAVASKIKISDVPDKPKATFLRKSAFLTTGDESFKFNFNLTPEQLDDANNVVKSGNTNESNITDANTNKVNEDSAKSFKFSFTDSVFKFNFNVEDS